MTRFGAQQRGVEPRQLGIEVRRKRGEALAGARFDEGTGYQGIDQAGRFVGAHQVTQAARIAGSTERPIIDAALLHQRDDLLEMAQFLACQT